MKTLKNNKIFIRLIGLLVAVTAMTGALSAPAVSAKAAEYDMANELIVLEQKGTYALYDPAASLEGYVAVDVSGDDLTYTNGEVVYKASGASSIITKNGSVYCYASVPSHILKASANGYASLVATVQLRSSTSGSKDKLDKTTAYFSSGEYGEMFSLSQLGMVESKHCDDFEKNEEATAVSYQTASYQTATLRLNKVTGSKVLLLAKVEHVKGSGILASTNTIMGFKNPTIAVESSDSTAPVAAFAISNGEWSNQSKTLTVTVTDSESGVQKVVYQNQELTPLSISEDTKTATYEIEVTQNGAYAFVVTDNVGNSSTVSYTESKIDTTAPAVTLDLKSVYHSKTVVFSAEEIKGGSKNTFVYTMDGSEPTEHSTPLLASNSFTLTQNGTITVRVKGWDEAGNESEASYDVTVDDTVYEIRTSVKNGKVTPSFTAMLADVVTVSFVPSEGYELYMVTLNGKPVDQTQALSFSVTDSATVDVVFRKRVTLSIVGDPVFSPDGVQVEWQTNAHSSDVFDKVFRKNGEICSLYDAGDYQVEYSVDNADYVGAGTIDFTVLPMAVTVSATERYEYAEPFVFDYELSCEIPHVLSFYIDGAECNPSVPNVYDYTVVSADPNYQIIHTSQIEIVKRRVSFSIFSSRIFDGRKLALPIRLDCPAPYTVNLSLDGELVPALYHSGRYTYEVSIDENPLYEGETQGEYIVLPRPVTVTAHSVTVTYGEELPALTYELLNEGDDTTQFSLECHHNGVAGTYPITIVKQYSRNYLYTYKNATYTIRKAKATVVIEPGQSKFYGEEDSIEYRVDGLVNGDSLYGEIERDEGETVGFYGVTAGTLSHPCYEISCEPTVFKILPQQIMIRAQAQSKVYGEEDPRMTYDVLFGSLVGDDRVVLTREAGELVGKYPISIQLNDNYLLIPVENYLTVTPKRVEVVFDDVFVTYGEKADIAYEARGLIGEDTLSGQPCYDGGTRVGSYPIGLGTLANPNYELSFTPAVYTITPAFVSVFANESVKGYGEEDELFYRVEGLREGDTLSGRLSRAQGEDVGAYDITMGTLSHPDYEIDFVSSTLTITPALLTVTVSDAKKVYGEEDPTLKAEVVGWIGYDDFPLRIERELGESVGTYRTKSVSIPSENYEISFSGGLLTIEKASVCFELEDQETVYNGEAQYIAEKAKSAHEIRYEYYRFGAKVDAPVNAGEYEVRAIFDGDENYRAYTATATFTIHKRKVPVILSTASVEYTGAPIFPQVTALAEIALLVEYTDVEYAVEKGSYRYTVTVADENYELFVEAVLTIV